MLSVRAALCAGVWRENLELKWLDYCLLHIRSQCVNAHAQLSTDDPYIFQVASVRGWKTTILYSLFFLVTVLTYHRPDDSQPTVIVVVNRPLNQSYASYM
jgi:hypothetical protein